MPGPVPKREDQRQRRNKPDIETDSVQMSGEVAIPPLGIPNCNEMVEDFYYSLAESGQAKFYEPSDWQFARIVCHYLNRQLSVAVPSAQMLASLNSMMSNLLVTEGDRRRVRLEVERQKTEGGKLVDISTYLREQFEKA